MLNTFFVTLKYFLFVPQLTELSLLTPEHNLVFGIFHWTLLSIKIKIRVVTVSNLWKFTQLVDTRLKYHCTAEPPVLLVWIWPDKKICCSFYAIKAATSKVLLVWIWPDKKICCSFYAIKAATSKVKQEVQPFSDTYSLYEQSMALAHR